MGSSETRSKSGLLNRLAEAALSLKDKYIDPVSGKSLIEDVMATTGGQPITQAFREGIIISTPPRLSEKEKKAKKSELEFVFRSEVRSLKAISRRVITACSDNESSLVDLENLNSEYNTCLNLVHTRFDELASFLW